MGRSPFPLAIPLLLAPMLFPLSAYSQSLDDVHVIPRPTTQPEAPSEVSPQVLSDHSTPLRVDVDLVLVPVTVTDAMNRPVLGLTKNDFQLSEELEQQVIQFFTAEDAPISIGLILDLSKSMQNKFVTEREAVEQFFNNANAKDDYFVITFADKPKLLASSTQSIEDIQQKLAASNPEGRTALLDAVYLALAKMRFARYERKALLIISDGGDNHSRYGLGEIKKLVQEADVEAYAIGIFDSLLPFRSFEEMMGKRWLGEITDATGGRTVTVTDLEKLPQTAASLSREMRTQYVLGYRPQHKISHDGRWRRIRVQVTPPPTTARVQAYYKKGYAAPAK